MSVFERTYRTQIVKDGSLVPLSASETLAMLGPVIPVSISPTKEHVLALEARGEGTPEPVSTLALIDTGASRTCICGSVFGKLGIAPVSIVETFHTHGSEMCACYPIDIGFPGTPLPSETVYQAVSINLEPNSQFHVLFGRNLLSRIRFTYNGPMGRIEIAI
jgi:predicted aspartyl protease